MTGNNTKAVKTFLLLLVFFTAIILVYFYATPQDTGDNEQVEMRPRAKKTRAIAWERLRDLQDNAKVEVRINDARTIAEVMRSDAHRQQGLSGREKLAENEGMMFIFDREEKYAFWNNNMKFPIEVIWMARGEVVSVSPLPLYDGHAPAVITAPSPVDAVLEVPAGFAHAHTIMVGNTIAIYETQ